MTKSQLLILCCSSVLTWHAVPAAETSFPPDQLEFFEINIRPILVEHCQECHGEKTQEAGLRLDSRQSLLKGGETGPAIVPGNVSEGELLQALLYDPDGYQMPPAGKLPQTTIDLIKKWVQMGAPWPQEEVVGASREQTFDLNQRAEHWSFRPLEKNEPPAVVDTDWCLNAIDQFVQAKRTEHNLSPAEPADRRTWIRRATLDVIGLPPTVAEIDAFLADDSPHAYEKVVDRLLASPHFGERWGRHWLDVVRYAESRGHEFDEDVANPWQYRDYVIRALNADVPFNQFVVEHIAGDLLTEQTTHRRRADLQSGRNESILGTGFWFLGEWVHSPVDIRQEEADRFDNMIDVYAKAFLGLTVACARCHDHKFDPIRQKDYYALQGFLQSSSYQQARFETMIHNEEIARKLEELDQHLVEQLQAVLRTEANSVVPRLADLLLAAQLVLNEKGTAAEKSTLFESFEAGTYAGWTVTGDAFGTTPQTQATLPSYQGDVGAVGNYFLNSHHTRDGGSGDAATGTLTSAEFEIQCDSIQMLVGGGSHSGRTCVNLLVAGEVVKTATGKNSNRMSPVNWNVRSLRGRTAQLQIVDAEQGGWGNIGVDHILFVDRTEVLPLVERVALERKLVPELLLEWVHHLDELEDQQDPLFLFATLSKNPTTGQRLPQVAEELLSRHSTIEVIEASAASANIAQDKQSRTPFETLFAASDLIPTGPGYQLVSTERAALQEIITGRPASGKSLPSQSFLEWNPLWNSLQEPSSNQPEPGGLRNWKRSGRFVRTPTFPIESGQVHCLVRGQVNTYVAVDSHILIKGPLHGKLTKTHPPNTEWHWITHEVADYQGHSAHLEMMPVDDEGFAVQVIIQTPQPEVARSRFSSNGLSDLSRSIATEIQELSKPTPADVAHVIQRQFSGSHKPATEHFCLHHPALFGLTSTAEKQKLAERIERYQVQKNEQTQGIKVVSASAPSMLDGTASDEYVFIRGNWKKRGETVPRRFLEVFGGSAISVHGSGRLQLAEQMVDPVQTPILPRVIVNRLWHHYFGRGICPTPNDFGHLGRPASHPELLDWLALELVNKGWSLKTLHRHILLSATYRMSSQADNDSGVAERDPENVFLHRMNVKRLEGEAIRDSILFVSGSLNPQMYGPSIPIHLTPFLEGRGRPGQSGPIDGEGRRSLYLAVRRNFPEPFFQAFDFPNPHSSTGNRNVSNVPAQALALMNNPLVLAKSQQWGARILQHSSEHTLEGKIELLFLEAYSRPPSEHELTLGKQFILEQIEDLKTDVNDPQIWADYCHVLFNAKEFIFVR